MDSNIKAITEFARKVKRIRKLEQKAYKALSKANSKSTNSSDLANEHEIAMVATSQAERDLSSLVIRLLVNRKPSPRKEETP